MRLICRLPIHSAGRLIRETRPLNAEMSKTYGPGDEVRTETDADGITMSYAYDERLRRKTATDVQRMGQSTIMALLVIFQVVRARTGMILRRPAKPWRLFRARLIMGPRGPWKAS